MEIVPYILNVTFFVLALYWAAANAVLKPGQPTFGLFRYRDSPKQADTKPEPPGRAAVRGR